MQSDSDHAPLSPREPVGDGPDGGLNPSHDPSASASTPRGLSSPVYVTPPPNVQSARCWRDVGSGLTEWCEKERRALQGLLDNANRENAALRAKNTRLETEAATLRASTCGCGGKGSVSSTSEGPREASEAARLRRVAHHLQGQNAALRAELAAIRTANATGPAAPSAAGGSWIRSPGDAPSLASGPPTVDRRSVAGSAAGSHSRSRSTAKNASASDAMSAKPSPATVPSRGSAVGAEHLGWAKAKLLQEVRHAWTQLRGNAINEEVPPEVLRDTTIQALHQLVINFREEVDARDVALAARDDALAALEARLKASDGQSTPSSSSSLTSGGEPMLPRIRRPVSPSGSWSAGPLPLSPRGETR